MDECAHAATVWASAWDWRCLGCQVIGQVETAIIGDPLGVARRPAGRAVKVHANEDYLRGFVDGRGMGCWEVVQRA